MRGVACPGCWVELPVLPGASEDHWRSDLRSDSRGLVRCGWVQLHFWRQRNKTNSSSFPADVMAKRKERKCPQSVIFIKSSSIPERSFVQNVALLKNGSNLEACPFSAFNSVCSSLSAAFRLL